MAELTQRRDADQIVFVDIETSDLDPTKGEVLEIAWAMDEEPSDRIVLPHVGMLSHPKALEINGYRARELWDRSTWCLPEDVSDFFWQLRDRTFAGMGPWFDDEWLRRLNGGQRDWNYRLLDVGSYAAGHFGWPRSRGLNGTYEYLKERIAAQSTSDSQWLPPQLTEPDHSAQRDVECVRDIYRICKEGII